jgi:hypothetical protein
LDRYTWEGLLTNAVKNNYPLLVKNILLRYPEIDTNNAIYSAIENANTEIIKILMPYLLVDQAAIYDAIVDNTDKINNLGIEFMEVLLQLPLLDGVISDIYDSLTNETLRQYIRTRYPWLQ